MQTKRQGSIVGQKLLYTAIILLVYLIGKSMPLYGIDVSLYIHKSVDAEELLLQTINGDIYKCSLLALGISPYMISSMLVQMIRAVRSSEAKARMSPKKTNQMTLGLTFMLATFMSLTHVNELVFLFEGKWLYVAKTTAVIEMITGVMIILWLSERNKKYGIGGQTALIFVNILEGIVNNLRNQTFDGLGVMLLISIIVMIIMIFMENTEFRIPLQRISIHNVYADKNYMAIKLNPIGVMPAMFSTAFFMLPQLVINGLVWLFPDNRRLLWGQTNMKLTEPLGIAVYIVVLYFLTIFFSRIFLHPGEMTEQFLKSGDSIVNIHAGKDTKRYIARKIFVISLLSATVMSICLGVPLYLQMKGVFEGTMVSLPSSFMMLTGIWSNLYREVEAVKGLDSYKPFI